MKELIDIFLKYGPRFIPGLMMTLQLSLLSIILGTFLGLLATMLKLSRIKPLMLVTDSYVTIIRGTPLLLQLIFFYNFFSTMPPFYVAVFGLSLHSGAYISEIFRGAIESINFGQREAARALGMTKWQTMKRVILPQAIRRAIPSLGNQFIISIKDSSLASVIAVTEILQLSRQFVSATYNPSIFIVAGIYYLVICTALAKLLALLEKKLKVGERVAR